MSAKAIEVINKAISENRRKLLEHESMALLEAYGIPLAPYVFIRDESEAHKADNIGYPVVAKVVSPDIVHKSDVGGVILGLNNWREVEQAVKTIKLNVKEKAGNARITGFLLQKMLPRGGVEVIVGGIRDPVFDAVIMFGLGGVFVEVFKDVSFRVTPVSVNEAKEMIREIKSFTILQGYRGASPVNIDSLAEIIVKASQLMSELREVSEMDINPVIAYPDGAYAVDARFLLNFKH
uniref:Acetyl-CoA synthetase n=1 Tax=Fervidicoccus fontis TaxID=683846 RepID=A0A7C1E9C9_9CREN